MFFFESLLKASSPFLGFNNHFSYLPIIAQLIIYVNNLSQAEP